LASLLKNFKAPKPDFSSYQNCSILIPFRNEENQLTKLFNSILELNFPIDSFEIIFIDDHSDDHSSQRIKNFINNNPKHQISLIQNLQGEGKKKAIEQGLLCAKYDIIIQTDADCEVDKDWLKFILLPFENKECNAVVARVKMISDDSISGKLMALEFASLQASGLSLAMMNLPIMSNGANLAYRKSKIPKNIKGQNWASGDDVFLIQSLSMENKDSVAVQPQALVKTNVPGSISEFFKQRIRWGSKTTDYPMKKAKWIAALVFLLSISQILLLTFGFLEPRNFMGFLLIYFIKLIPDYILLRQFLKNEEDKDLLKWVPFLALLYPLYISFTSLYILFGSMGLKWKDRSIHH
tara:strand:+ start:1890 stop:2945 length:1056 start_codon:yes stop_codon:yes gene_type:complete